jgi:hypothetical protein
MKQLADFLGFGFVETNAGRYAEFQLAEMW